MDTFPEIDVLLHEPARLRLPALLSMIRRADFTSVVARDGFDALLTTIRSRIADLAAGRRRRPCLTLMSKPDARAMPDADVKAGRPGHA